MQVATKRSQCPDYPGVSRGLGKNHQILLYNCWQADSLSIGAQGSCGKHRDGFFLRAESFYNLATNLEQLGGTLLNSYGGQSLHDQSHGEAFLATFLNRFTGVGLYILDEPESALSPLRQMTLLARMLDILLQPE